MAVSLKLGEAGGPPVRVRRRQKWIRPPRGPAHALGEWWPHNEDFITQTPDTFSTDPYLWAQNLLPQL